MTRSYAVRAQRLRADGSTGVDLGFVLHDTGGPGCRWAMAATPGDRLTVLRPAAADNAAVRFRPPADTDWVLIRADETALPAAAAALEWLPAGLPARVWLEVPRTEDRQALNTAAKARIRWLVRSEGAVCGVETVRVAELPGGTPYAWIAGEASGVRALRHHLVHERGFDRERVTSPETPPADAGPPMIAPVITHHTCPASGRRGARAVEVGVAVTVTRNDMRNSESWNARSASHAKCLPLEAKECHVSV